jgi:hypothetical protein
MMNSFIKAGTALYNAKINGCYSDQSREKMRGKMVGKRNRFNRGCISHYPHSLYPQWRFSWRENGIGKIKSFSVKTYGEWGARKMAEYWRANIFPLES